MNKAICSLNFMYSMERFATAIYRRNTLIDGQIKLWVRQFIYPLLPPNRTDAALPIANVTTAHPKPDRIISPTFLAGGI